MSLPEQFHDFLWFAERFFWIRDRYGERIPFKANPMQRALLGGFTGRDDILKARQGGASTLAVLRMVHGALTHANFRGVILAHEYRSALELAEIVQFAIRNLPEGLKPRLEVDTRQEIKIAATGSRILCATARNPDIGRGGSINHLLCSEIASWANPTATLAAINPSVGPSSHIIRESTAKGAGTYWHREWLRTKNGVSGYRPHFFSWTIEPAYAIHEPDPQRDPAEFRDGQRLPFVFSERELQMQLTEAQARWRRRTVGELAAMFPQEYAEDDVTCFLTTGRSVFDNMEVQKRYEELIALQHRGELVLHEDPKLGLKIFHEFTQRKQVLFAEYVIGADPAEGIADPTDPRCDGDYSTASVIERRTGLQVASIHGSWEPHEFATILSKVARRYVSPSHGLPLLGVERNNHGYSVLTELDKHYHYPRLYRHSAWDKRRGKQVQRLGFPTNKQTRPIMLDDFGKAFTRNFLKIRDPELLAECLTFVNNSRGRPEAQVGCHDDRVMATAIAWQMRQQPGAAPVMATNLP